MTSLGLPRIPAAAVAGPCLLLPAAESDTGASLPIAGSGREAVELVVTVSEAPTARDTVLSVTVRAELAKPLTELLALAISRLELTALSFERCSCKAAVSACLVGDRGGLEGELMRLGPVVVPVRSMLSALPLVTEVDGNPKLPLAVGPTREELRPHDQSLPTNCGWDAVWDPPPLLLASAAAIGFASLNFAEALSAVHSEVTMSATKSLATASSLAVITAAGPLRVCIIQRRKASWFLELEVWAARVPSRRSSRTRTKSSAEGSRMATLTVRTVWWMMPNVRARASRPEFATTSAADETAPGSSNAPALVSATSVRFPTRKKIARVAYRLATVRSRARLHAWVREPSQKRCVSCPRVVFLLRSIAAPSPL
jgi:hypothetical protein